MFYGGLLAILYVATGRLSFVVIGLLAFALGAWYLGTHIPHVHARVTDWLHPFDPRVYKATLGSYQGANGVFAQAAGGMFGQGFGQAVIPIPASHPIHYPIPAPQSDMYFAYSTAPLVLLAAV